VAIHNLGDVAVHVVEHWDRLAAGWLVRFASAGGQVAVSGGSTPRRAYELAAELLPDWSGAHVWFCDDRVVPPADERSNYRLLQESLLVRLADPPIVHRIEGELDADEAAARYDAEMSAITLDLALVGIGPDGHTASLFPNAPALEERERRAVAAEPAFEPFVSRVTLTPPVFEATGLLVYLATGADKAEAVRRAFAEDPSPATPASLIRGRETIAIVDPAAASLL
jgi:6-phosphogluconolactonase